MSHALVTAAVLIILTGLAHSILGERYILIRLFRRQDLPKLFGGVEFTKNTLRFAWHLTSVAWWGIASILLVLAYSGGHPPVFPVARVVAVTAGLSGVVALVGSKARHPSWIVFFLVALLTWRGI